MGREPPQLRVVTFGELRRADLAELVAISREHHRSLAEHPYARDDEAAFLLLLAGDRRVARFGLLPGRIRAGTEMLPVSWGSEFDYDGDPAHRGHAGLLFVRAMEHAGSYCGAGPSGLFEPLLRAAGLRLEPVRRYATLLRSAPFLARTGGAIAALAAPVADRVLAAERRLRRSGTRDVELVAVERFDARIRAFEAARGTCAPYRDDVELNWVMARPWIADAYAYRPYLLHERGALAGFLLARVRRSGDRTIASVMRMAVADRRRDLAQGALSALVRSARDADVVEIHTNEPHVAAAAVALGLRARGALRVTARFARAAEEALGLAGCALGTMPLQHGEGDIIFA